MYVAPNGPDGQPEYIEVPNAVQQFGSSNVNSQDNVIILPLEEVFSRQSP